MFRRYVEAELDRVRHCPQAAMLSDKALERLDESLTRTAEFVAGDTATHLVAEALADENPVAAEFPDLITAEERGRALDEIRQALRSFDPNTTVRVVLRPTRGYWKILQKLSHHTALESDQARERNMETLAHLLRESDVTLEESASRGRPPQVVLANAHEQGLSAAR